MQYIHARFTRHQRGHLPHASLLKKARSFNATYDSGRDTDSNSGQCPGQCTGQTRARLPVSDARYSRTRDTSLSPFLVISLDEEAGLEEEQGNGTAIAKEGRTAATASTPAGDSLRPISYQVSAPSLAQTVTQCPVNTHTASSKDSLPLDDDSLRTRRNCRHCVAISFIDCTPSS